MPDHPHSILLFDYCSHQIFLLLAIHEVIYEELLGCILQLVCSWKKDASHILKCFNCRRIKNSFLHKRWELVFYNLAHEKLIKSSYRNYLWRSSLCLIDLIKVRHFSKVLNTVCSRKFQSVLHFSYIEGSLLKAVTAYNSQWRMKITFKSFNHRHNPSKIFDFYGWKSTFSFENDVMFTTGYVSEIRSSWNTIVLKCLSSNTI